MSLFRTLISHRVRASYVSRRSLPLSSLFYCTKTSFANIDDKIEPENGSGEQVSKKPLDVMFREAVSVGFCENDQNSESEKEGENSELKSRLRGLEREVRWLKANSSGEERVKNQKPKKNKATSLYAAFTNQKDRQKGCEERRQEPQIYKELSPEMEVFVKHLYEEGYFNKANFLPGNRLEFGCFESHYGRGFIKFAAERFARDNQEVAKWLSGGDLKKVALFGCPSLERKNIFAAKRLRKFFEIHENTVCSNCVLKQSCKFENQSVWKGDTKNLNLAVVMKVIILYALEWVPPELSVSSEVKASVNKLLKEVVKLSRTLS